VPKKYPTAVIKPVSGNDILVFRKRGSQETNIYLSRFAGGILFLSLCILLKNLFVSGFPVVVLFLKTGSVNSSTLSFLSL